MTSLLSISEDERGVPQAHLAPVAVGDWDHAYQTAEYLLDVAARTQDVGHVLDAAEGMAVATQQRELWDSPQGIPLQEDVPFVPVGMEIE